MIDFHKYTDQIYCINYLNNGNTPELKRRLNSVGIDTSDGNFCYFFNDTEHVILKFEEQSLINRSSTYLLNTLYTKDYLLTEGSNYSFVIGYNTYRVLKMAQYMGYERIMIFEDDIVFHKDHEFIKSNLDIINSTNFDYCSLQTSFWNAWYGDKQCLLQNKCSEVSNNILRINPYTSIGLYGGAWLIFTKQGINKLIKLFEDNDITTCIDVLAEKNCHLNFDIIFALESLALQNKNFENQYRADMSWLNKNNDLNKYDFNN